MPLGCPFTFRTCCAGKDQTLPAFLFLMAMLSSASRGHWGAIAGRRSLLWAAFAFSCSCCALCRQSTWVGTSGRARPSHAPRVDSPWAASQPQPWSGDHLGVTFPTGTLVYSGPHVSPSAIIPIVYPLPQALGLLHSQPCWPGHCVLRALYPP